MDSKIEGAKRVAHLFAGKETIAVGDGFTDYMLYKEGLAQQFVAYVEHAAREKVIAVAPVTASSAAKLREHIIPPNEDAGKESL